MHVEGFERFALDLVMIDNRALAHHDFRNSIGEMLARAEVALDDRALRVRAYKDQRAGVLGLVKLRLICDVDRIFEYGSAEDLMEGDIAEIGSVQGGEGVEVELRVLGEVGAGGVRDGAGGRKRLPHLEEFGDGSDVGETPLFLVRGWEAQLLEALQSGFPQGLNPNLFGDRRGHAFPTASASS